ncbi:MAG: FHA domain-containing protein [Chloroflexota bacterium]
MMEMIEERQELGNDEIHSRVERVLDILNANISAPVSAVYKEKLNATLDIKSLRGMLEALAPELPKDGLDDDALLEKLDLSAWLSLILGRWVLFEPMLKKTGRAGVQTLKDIYSSRSGDGKFISTRDARHVAVAAHDLLTELDCKEAAQNVAVIRDELLELIDNQDGHKPMDTKASDEIPTIPAIQHKWLGVHENGEKPALAAATNHHDTKNNVPRVDRNRTKQLKPPADLLFLKLEIVEKNGTIFSQTIDIKQPTMFIGRGQMADVELHDPLVSRMHLMITGTTPYSMKITDLNSSNGTCLDGVQLKPNETVYWDVGKPVVIGETWMILRHTS